MFTYIGCVNSLVLSQERSTRDT